MSAHGKKSLWLMNADRERAAGLVQEDSTAKSASIAPLFALYFEAWDLAQADGALLERLEHAAEALALSRAIAALVQEAVGGSASLRWAVKVSEAEHLVMVMRDALTSREEGYP
ncbi:MAG TPA: hypothetical protein DDY39_07715 [Nitrospira sp.]|nr:hypothetical protein [Nitrospira sp.]